MPELKLTNSHGSTAASQFPSHTSYAPEVPNKGPATNPLSHVSHANSHSHASAPAPAPAPVAGTEHAYSVTGTEHAYSHGDKTNVTPNSDDMGNEASKLKIKLSHLNPRDQRSVGSQQQGHGGLVSMSDSALDQVPRLPTPEYQMQDIRTPLVDGIVSPLSPAPSPHPPSEEQQAGPKPQAKPSIQRKAIGGRDLHSTKSLPQIRTEGPGITNAEPFPLALSTPIVAQGAIASPSSGHAAASGQPQSQPQPQLQPQQGFRPRTGSRSQEQRPVGLPLGPPALREKRSQASSLRSPHPGMQPSPESRTFPELRGGRPAAAQRGGAAVSQLPP
ncbi:predicted protein [Verticillium alfalfae VaMs.102]|uniref:Predicted protein n=1 Tax=Verticillium alfalfae (strain VaMs.102 / ATCC MYA-4576 / FGSC 10136) TaxID=526221 RepID=C9SVC7_VERA1|nr:predicted protein [Verticillium alfalfae VaMs.102]EEY22742.1 predicted protein [Verticillium alfalfae VaMs.102]